MSADLQDLGFDANEVDPSFGFKALPVGDYKVMAIESERLRAKDPANPSEYLKIVWEVIDGDFRGRKIFDNLHLWNKGDKAETTVGIAKAKFSGICRAVDVPKPKQTAEIHGKPLVVSLKMGKPDQNGNPTNEVSGYASLVDAGSRPATPKVVMQTSVGVKPPWKK